MVLHHLLVLELGSLTEDLIFTRDAHLFIVVDVVARHSVDHGILLHAVQVDRIDLQLLIVNLLHPIIWYLSFAAR